MAGSVANLASPAATAAGTAGQAAAGAIPGATIPASALTSTAAAAPAVTAPTLASTAGEIGMANAFNPLTGAPLTATTAQAAPMGMFNQFSTAGVPSDLGGSLLSADKVPGLGIQLQPNNFSPTANNLYGFEGAASGQGITPESLELAGAAPTRMLETGGIEGFQEGMANILQDLNAKGIYNPNLSVGESALGDAAMGASVGAFAQGAIELVTKGKRTQQYEALKAQERREEFERRLQEEDDKYRAEIEQTKQNLGVQTADGQPILALPAPPEEVSPAPETNPLLNPLGKFTQEEIGADGLTAVNEARKKKGLTQLDELSIEDMVDANVPQGEIDRLLTFKSGYDGATELDSNDVMNVAQSKNVDTTTQGFKDFLRRVTGTDNLSQMSPPQLFSAFTALDKLDASETLQILPEGTNASRFTEQQYENAFKALENKFTTSEVVSLEEALKEVKKSSGLKDVQDADALIQTAIRNGELDAVAAPRYDVVDGNGRTIRTYLKRESAEAAAAKQGFSVRESTSINLQYPGKVAGIENAPEIREATLKTGVEPEGFEIRSPDKVLATVKSQEEAAAKAERMAAVRENNAVKLENQIQKEQAKIDGTQRRLEQMEAAGESDTVKFKKLAAQLDADNKKSEARIAELERQAAAARAPLSVTPKGEQAKTKKGFTVVEPAGEQGALVAAPRELGTFPTREAAEQAAIANMPDQALQRLVASASTAKGIIPKRLAATAQKELSSRARKGKATLLQEPQPTGIPVSFKGTREQAEKTLADAGIFTPQVRQQVEELDKRLRPIMDKLGLKDLRLNVMRSIQSEMGTADGYYFQKLIAIALDAPNPIRILRHEGIHALKELGAFTPAQWKVLEDRARKEWVSKYNIKDRYKGLDQEAILEEAIADAFSDFDQAQAPAGLIGTIFRNIKAFMGALGNAFRGLGFNTPESIFQQVEAGQMVTREPAVMGERKFSKKYEETANVSPLDVNKARIYEKELEGLIKKVGSRIAGMKSDETVDHVRQAVKKLQSFTAQGLEGKDWYENSAKAVLEAFDGDKVLAEKFFQIIAITSGNTEVAANFTKTTNAWSQFAKGKPIKVGTTPENEKINSLLNFGEDWGGRKTNTFYTNLMEAMEGTDTGKATIDLHMTRMLFDQDKPTNAQYELAENMVGLLASKLGVPARQVQAASWVTQKSKSIFDYYRERGWKKNLSDEELRLHAMEIAVTDYSHLMEAKVKDLPVTPELQELSSDIRARVQNITGEVIPSVKTEMSQAEEMDFKAKEKLTKKIANQKTIGELAKILGIKSKLRVTVGSGAYENKVNPNLVVQVVNKDSEAAVNDARDLAKAMSYVFKQDATPFFRADDSLIGKDQIGLRFKFTRAELTPTQQKNILAAMQEKFGEGVGFTKIRGNEIVVINYRGEDGTPFLVPDEDFISGMGEIIPAISEIAEIEASGYFGAQSEYPYHDWENDTRGTGLVEGLLTNRPGRPYIQRGLDDVRESFIGDVRAAVGESGATPRFSLRLDESTIRPSAGSGIVLGEQQSGAISVDGVHYGREQVNTLSGNKYGTGIRGAEAERLNYATDPRIKRRVYFYAPTEFNKMKSPEPGLGNYVYVQKFNNILGPGAYG